MSCESMTLREKIAEIITESWYEANELVSADRILALMEEENDKNKGWDDLIHDKDKQVSRYREALEKIVKTELCRGDCPVCVHDLKDIAKSALQNEGE